MWAPCTVLSPCVCKWAVGLFGRICNGCWANAMWLVGRQFSLVSWWSHAWVFALAHLAHNVVLQRAQSLLLSGHGLRHLGHLARAKEGGRVA